jgi:hypothetical protein
MPALHLSDNAVKDPVSDLVALQGGGHLLQEGVAAVDRERLGGGHDYVELAIRESDHRRARSARRRQESSGGSSMTIRRRARSARRRQESSGGSSMTIRSRPSTDQKLAIR